MADARRIKRRLDEVAAKGDGGWVVLAESGDLGDGLFASALGPSLKLYERGLVYEGNPMMRLRYDEVMKLETLDLPALMLASKVPDQLMEFGVETPQGRHVLRLHLHVYTMLVSILNDILLARHA